MKQLRVAVVGSGPAGLYAIEYLLEKQGIDVEIDLFERLPTPWGLVRAGVAPDHPDKKRVTDRQFDVLLKDSRVRFFGNVEVGRNIQPAELAAAYDAVIYAIGASNDVRMGIPGEELPGCWAAREFVGFYNGHPDYSHLRFDLSCQRAIVIGNGNVALDVARILTMPVTELERTDIADHALRALHGSAIREVVILGRRGHLQGAFHNPELEELEHLEGVDVLVDGDDLPGERNVAIKDADWETHRKVQTLRRLAARAQTPGHRRIVFRFLSSPVELLGRGKVEQAVIAHNKLDRDAQGQLRARSTEEKSIFDAGLVLRSIGYRGAAIAELPFDEARGVIANREGRVVEHGVVVPGIYVTGWIKRGCRGIIGSNRKCARDTVAALFEDLDAGRLVCRSPQQEKSAFVRLRTPDAITLSGWLAIDRQERNAGRAQNRPRVKLAENDELLAVAATRSGIGHESGQGDPR